MGRVSLVMMTLIAFAASSPMAVARSTNFLMDRIKRGCDDSKPPGINWANDWDA